MALPGAKILAILTGLEIPMAATTGTVLQTQNISAVLLSRLIQ
jgi:hypothetical protein